jgi:PiT family inorganic phosphate transporter
VGKLLGAVFLGWALGANDAANVFGPAVSARVVRYRTAILIAAVFVVLGAGTGGLRAIEAVGALDVQTPYTAFWITLAAALGMTLLIALRLPASSSQAIVGAIVGAALARHSDVDVAGIARLVRGWVLTPVTAALIGMAFTIILGSTQRWRPTRGLARLDLAVRLALLAAGAWGAYALGANNAANVTGVFAAAGLVSPTQAAWIAGGSIALGVLTFASRLMYLVGRGLVQLEPATALVAMISQALAVHAFALWGVPVSSSQALAGGVLGIGIVKGVRTINTRALLNILLGWVATPIVGALLAYFLLQVTTPP